MPEMTIPFNPCPTVGDHFPSLTVQTTQGTIRLPEDYRGCWFILFAHPGDFTPVCTTEYVAFQNLSKEFARYNTALIGLSVDQVQAHLKWIEWIYQNLKVCISFPIIADPAGIVSRSLGLLRGQSTRTVRTVFIVDPRGVIRLTLNYPGEVGRNTCEILRAVEALQIADRNQAATPANWPNNSLIGNNLIVPPASTVQEIQQRQQQAQAGRIQCYDWWFCYRPAR